MPLSAEETKELGDTAYLHERHSSMSHHTCLEQAHDDEESEILVFKDPIAPEDEEPNV